MRRFAETCEAVASTTKKTEKVRRVSNYLRSLSPEEARRAAVFLTGQTFPRAQEKALAVGASLVWEAVVELTGVEVEAAERTYRKHGDLGGMVEEVLADRGTSPGVSLAELEAAFRDLAEQRGPAAKIARLKELFRRVSRLEAKYIAKIITGDLRIGLRENLLEEALAAAYGCPLKQVQRANMLTGDIAETLRLAAAGRLESARLRLFHPISFMLANPAETAEEIFASSKENPLVEDKYDGVRAQAHTSGGRARLFSRTLDEMVEFPELLRALERLRGEFVLDGEVVAWRQDRALPFHELQKRLGRKQPQLWLPQQVPVRFLAFDLLYADGELLLDAPLAERRARLEDVLANTADKELALSPARACRSPEEMQNCFDAALARANEGVVAKAPDSLYTPGRRGRAWRKLKRPLATLDVVVTAAEYGHGKRAGWLSDLTFAVRAGDRLVSIGKAYSGLTDEEIRQLTHVFQKDTIADEGFRRRVKPTVVLEVAFNNLQQSRRHESGYALRFPRIVRLRPDKRVEDIDTLDRVKEIYERQAGRLR